MKFVHACILHVLFCSRSQAFWVGNGTWEENQYLEHGRTQYGENTFLLFLNSCDYISVIHPSGRVFLWTEKVPVLSKSEIKSSQLPLMLVYILKCRQLEVFFLTRIRWGFRETRNNAFKVIIRVLVGKHVWFYIPQSHCMLCNRYWHQSLYKIAVNSMGA